MPADDVSMGSEPESQQGRRSRARLQAREPDVRSDAVAIGAAVGVVGAVFGVLARGAGLGVVETCTMSLLVFTGASQLTAVSVVASGGAAIAAAASALLLAGRNALYGAVVAPWLEQDGRIARLVATQLVIDESTGIGAAQADPRARRRGFWAAGASVYVFWNLGTLLGALAGSGLGERDVRAWGLDAAFPAAFVALLIPHLRTRSGRAATLVGTAVAAVAVSFLPAGVPVLVASVGAAVGAVVAHREGRP